MAPDWWQNCTGADSSFLQSSGNHLPRGVKLCHTRMMLVYTHFAAAPVATQGVHNQGPDVCLDIAAVGGGREKRKENQKKFGKRTE